MTRVESVMQEALNLDFERGKVFGLNFAAKIVEQAKEVGDDPVTILKKMADAMDRFCDQQASKTGSPTGP